MGERDEELVERCRRGDRAAFESLYAAHAGRIKAYLLRSGFSPADADDQSQETFLRAYRSLATFDAARGTFAGWLGAIARNVARRHWNRRADARDFDPDLAERTLAAADNPHADAARREQADAVRDCVGRLPDELARIVRLRYVEARTTRGVAAAAGIPEATVRLRLAEARAALARCLKGKGVLG